MFAAVAHREDPDTSGDRRRLRALIAGGHTGGHIQCALAIAAALERARPGTVCVLGGAAGGPEVAAAQAAGYAIETVWIGAFDRRRSVAGLARNLVLVAQLAVSRGQARAILARVRPDLVIGVGGYPSAPFVLEAQRRGVPTLLHEANALPGVANRFLARRAQRVCIGDPAAAGHFPPTKTVVTGNPSRPDLMPMAPAKAREILGFHPDRQTILVTGGSLGSPVLNDWVLSAAGPLAAAGVQTVWQCGRAHEARLKAQHPPARPIGFIEDMAAAYAAADLVVAPAGALTVAELARLGKAAILVPTPDLTEDHQTRNARSLGDRGVPICLPIDVPRLLTGRVLGLLGDDEERRAVSSRLAATAGAGSAADRIAAEALALVELSS